MLYRLKYRAKAKDEYLKASNSYGEKFAADLSGWLNSLAQEASLKRNDKSADFLEFLEHVSNWRKHYRRWLEAPPLEKIAALIHVVRRRSPPWEIRMTMNWFSQILGAFDAEVQLVYEVDHVKKEIVVVMFMGLPGSDSA